MQLQRQSNGQIITLDPNSVVGHGGEARVYTVPQDKTLVAKVYHKPTEAHAHKLVAMLANPPDNPLAGQGQIAIAWPVDLLQTADAPCVVGFLMPQVKGMRSILDFYNPKTRRQQCPLFNYLYLHRTARNLAAAMGALHARGYCVGDVNESNILVSDTALVTLVDTDSFQVRDPKNGFVYRCGVGKPEFTPPELQGKSFAQLERSPEHDLFGLAVLIFQLLMEGTHPFSGIFQGLGDPPTYEARIAAGHFSYSKGRRVPYSPTPVAPPFAILPSSLQQLFVRCFEDGHTNPLFRPNAQTWQDALNEAEIALVTCPVNHQHQYGKHLNTCPWCERAVKLSGRDPFPSRQAVQQKHHLQPIQRKPAARLGGRSLKPLPKAYTGPQPKPRSATIPKKKRLDLFALGLFGGSVCGYLVVMVMLRDSTFAPPFLSVPPTSVASPEAKINSGSAVRTTTQSPFEQGNADYKLGDYEGAIESFSQTLHLNPQDAKAYVNRGKAYYELAKHSGDPDKAYRKAIADFNAALRLDPQQAEAALNRGMVRYEVAQYSTNPDKEYQGAIADLSAALQLKSNDAEAYVTRGIIRYKLTQYNGDSERGYRGAIEDFDRALRLNPSNAEAYSKRGIVRYELAQYGGNSIKDYREADEDLQKAAKLFLEHGDIDNYQQAQGNSKAIAVLH